MSYFYDLLVEMNTLSCKIIPIHTKPTQSGKINYLSFVETGRGGRHFQLRQIS